jgi:hypothetical protein
MRLPALLLTTLLLAGGAGGAGAAETAKNKPFVMEYYYKVAWGHQGEFWKLFQKNHLPVLKKEMELGRILALKADKPKDHATEDGRWDFRVTITWRDAQTTDDDFDSAALAKQLYPDQATFEKEEQRRFEILQAHWDLPVESIDLKQTQ